MNRRLFQQLLAATVLAREGRAAAINTPMSPLVNRVRRMPGVHPPLRVVSTASRFAS